VKAFFLPVTASSANVTPSSDVIFLSLFFKPSMIDRTGKKGSMCVGVLREFGTQRFQRVLVGQWR
jgi:hypothetical protein